VRGEVELAGCSYRGTRLWLSDGRLEPQVRVLTGVVSPGFLGPLTTDEPGCGLFAVQAGDGEVFHVLVAERNTPMLHADFSLTAPGAGGTLNFCSSQNCP